MRIMQAQQLKSLVKSGRYKPEPSLVAEAMLQRRGVRELLAQELTLDAAGRTRQAPAAGRQAA
jgi:Arc/MetJ-type ribon-helix-helix transcriptional regulator